MMSKATNQATSRMGALAVQLSNVEMTAISRHFNWCLCGGEVRKGSVETQSPWGGRRLGLAMHYVVTVMRGSL